MVLPTPRTFKLLSTEKGAKGVSSFVERPKRNLLAQFPFSPTRLNRKKSFQPIKKSGNISFVEVTY